MADSLLVGILGVWLLLSVLVYVPALQPGIRRWDLLALVPEWRFFAPTPAQHDYYLLYRDQLEDGSLTDWTEVRAATPRCSWNLVWNTSKRGNKALFDAIKELAAHVVASDPAIQFSVPYLTLLNHVSAIPRLGCSQSTRFLLMHNDSRLEKPPDVVFLSGVHAVDS